MSRDILTSNVGSADVLKDLDLFQGRHIEPVSSVVVGLPWMLRKKVGESASSSVIDLLRHIAHLLG